MVRELVIGALALQDKDAAVLQVLVKLLDGSMSLRLRFSEQLADCNIVFARPSHSGSLPGVVVQVVEGVPSNAVAPGDITVAAPLRMSGVMEALHKALARLHPPALADQTTGLVALFGALRHAMGEREPARCVIPLQSGHLLLIDAQAHRLQTSAPLELLLSGDGHPGVARAAGLVDEQLLRSSPTHALRDVVWRLAQRLVDVHAAPPELGGAWRLRRWPEAAGLKSPGHPRLAALLTAQCHTLDELVTLSGLPPLKVQWFLQCCLLFGLAEPVERSAVHEVPARQGAAPGWLGQLRERLRLW